RLTHWCNVAPSWREADEIGVRPSVVEPTRTSGMRRCSVGPVFVALAAETSRSAISLFGEAWTRSVSTFPLSLAVDAERRVRQGFEALHRNRLAAVRADAVGAVLDPLQCRIDLGEHVLRVLLQRVVELAVLGLRRRIGELIDASHLLAVFVRERAGVAT